ncbi:thiamine pyrophosphate-dependent enzyme [Argonema antarcticum]|uniref:thiamine pyrophosphate-dependent enzyme n=1 Tax=Argonema antarcticum TaxID=2942763 RepID=UPI002012355B|nr:thiamine pyrophosphate-dependent enzyme [Argonema antarcticum]MCL1475206.1 thiamine pyrophosphate-binding protein [Argonema antarcticum A004/B2]
MSKILTAPNSVSQQSANESLGAFPSLNDQSPAGESVAETVVKMLEDLGVKYAFGVSGGAIAPVWAALENSAIQVIHFRHEAGAAFAATEAYFASGDPVAVFTTAGPGITNALTGLFAARWEGAKVILISPSTSQPLRGRWACQETTSFTMPSDLFTLGSLFHYAVSIETGTELTEISLRLAQGLGITGGFVAHLSIPTAIQSSGSSTPLSLPEVPRTVFATDRENIVRSAELLSEGRFGIWVGFGAREAAAEIRDLAEKTGAAVMCSPRGKGIFPEDHPQFVGVTGFGGHASVLHYMREFCPERLLVLGTRLGEPTSFWSPAMVPSQGFIHVDIDPSVPGTAYPEAETLSVVSDIGIFVKAVTELLPESPAEALPHPQFQNPEQRNSGLVQPEILIAAIQRIVVEGSDAIVMAEVGNSFAWGINLLRFNEPNRYRVSTRWGSMGHFTTGVVGAALAREGKAVAIVGDGSMLMNCEISTAVRHKIPAVWIVLNDAKYNMCSQGAALQGFNGVDTEIPQADFVQIARAMGADGICVEQESELEEALKKAMASNKPFVVDVIIDSSKVAPISGRIKSLIAQGSK